MRFSPCLDQTSRWKFLGPRSIGDTQSISFLWYIFAHPDQPRRGRGRVESSKKNPRNEGIEGEKTLGCPRGREEKRRLRGIKRPQKGRFEDQNRYRGETERRTSLRLDSWARIASSVW